MGVYEIRVGNELHLAARAPHQCDSSLRAKVSPEQVRPEPPKMRPLRSGTEPAINIHSELTSAASTNAATSIANR